MDDSREVSQTRGGLVATAFNLLRPEDFAQSAHLTVACIRFVPFASCHLRNNSACGNVLIIECHGTTVREQRLSARHVNGGLITTTSSPCAKRNASTATSSSTACASRTSRARRYNRTIGKCDRHYWRKAQCRAVVEARLGGSVITIFTISRTYRTPSSSSRKRARCAQSN